jgi:hypothetical protein
MISLSSWWTNPSPSGPRDHHGERCVSPEFI